MHHLSWLKAGTIGFVQGVTEHFPVSRLGHGALIPGPASDRRVAGLGIGRAVTVGAAEIPALAPVISGSDVTMSAGLTREDAARFSFLLASPVILAAGVLKLGDLAGPLGDGIRPPVLFGSVLFGSVLFGSVLSGVGAYCIAAGAACVLRFAVR